MSWNNDPNKPGGQQPPQNSSQPPPPGGFGSPPPPQGGPGQPPPPGGFGGPAGPPGTPGGPGQPPGGFGSPTPPGGHGASGGSLDPMLAVKQGWSLVKKNMGVLAGASAVYLVAAVIVTFALSGADLMNPQQQQAAGQNPVVATGNPLANIIVGIMGLVAAVMLTNGATKAARGQKLAFPDLFSNVAWGAAIGAALVTQILTSAGVLLCVVGSLAAGAVFMYAMPAVVSGRDFSEGFKESWELGKANFWPGVVLVLLAFLVVTAGFLACCVGLVVAIPVAWAAVVCAYRQLRGEPIHA